MNKQQQAQYLENYYTGIIEQFVYDFIDLSDMQAENWYQDEHNNILEIAKQYNVPFVVYCAMVAVTSPMKRWTENIEFVGQILTNLQAGKKVVKESGMIRTANYARIIYNTTKDMNEDELTVEFFLNNFKGFADKTSAFFVNLYNPTNKDVLTVDVWMLRVGLAQYQQATNTFKVKKAQIDAMRRAYFNVYNSMKLESFGIVPHQLQAIIWTTIRKLETMRQWFLDFNDYELSVLKRVAVD